MEMSKLQNRIKYSDVAEIHDEEQSKILRMELKSSETRMRAVGAITGAYKTIINTMMHDSIYFDPVLSALEEDLNEQNDFIKKTISMGGPALKNLHILSEEYDVRS